MTLPGCLSASLQAGGNRKPNIVLILFDDLGYGDLNCYGDKLMKINTPHIDRVAAEGVRFTDFYMASNVCGPSRAALLTGRYPPRCGMGLQVDGLDADEITLGEMLKSADYATACVGKWAMRDYPPKDANSQGFDYWFGIGDNACQGAPMLENGFVVEAPPVDRKSFTRRYTEKAIDFIKQNKDKPFFVYLAHTHPHDPTAASEKFQGKSEASLYGDVVEELDWYTGKLMEMLKELNIDDDTLVVITSDNGADYFYNEGEGSNWPLRGGKSSTEEGGHRVPAIFRWPGKVKAGQVCSEMATAMDLFPTFAALGSAKLPTDRIIDGKNIWTLVKGDTGAKTPHEAFFYYNGHNLQAVRSGKWKLHLPRNRETVPYWQTVQGMTDLDKPLLYNLQADISEQHDVSEKHPEVVTRLLVLAEKCCQELGDTNRPGWDKKGPTEWPKTQKTIKWYDEDGKVYDFGPGDAEKYRWNKEKMIWEKKEP